MVYQETGGTNHVTGDRREPIIDQKTIMEAVISREKETAL